MTKKILIVVIIMLFITGCSGEYNLTIDGDIYKEEINIIGENSTEINSLNKKWQMPIDKEEYNYGGDPSSDGSTNNIYKYKLNNNILTFNYNFNMNNYRNSSAVSNCYDSLNVSYYVSDNGKSIIISTGDKNLCFERYSTLKNLVINITVDRPVINSNADKSDGNKYTWYINSTNAKEKSINLILDDTESNNGKTNNLNKGSIFENYMLYIFSAVFIMIILLGRLWFNRMKEKNNQI